MTASEGLESAASAMISLRIEACLYVYALLTTI